MRKNRTPQDNDFNLGKIFSIIEGLLYLISFIISLFQNHTGFISKKLFLILSTLLLIYIYCVNEIKEYKISNANYLRRKFFFDNSFNLKRFPHHNKDYFDNEDIEAGLKKTLANIHENLLFTSKIIEKMRVTYCSISFLLLVAMIVSLLFSGLTETNAILLGFILTGSIFAETKRLSSVQKEAYKIFLDANAICDNYDKTEEMTHIIPDILDILVRYEIITTTNTVVLSDYFYKKMNHELTREWNDHKRNYQIYKS